MVNWTCPQCKENMHGSCDDHDYEAVKCVSCGTSFLNPYYQEKERPMTTTARIKVDEYKKDPRKCIEQIEFCEYESEGGVLKNNVAWQAIKELLNPYYLRKK